MKNREFGSVLDLQHRCVESDTPQMLGQKGQHFVPRFPTAPLGGELRGYAALAQRPGGVGEASEPPHSWTAPRCLANRRELHRWLAVTDDPPIEP